MNKVKTKMIIRFILLFGTLVSMYFIPWPLIKARLAALPNTAQEQVDKAADYGFDGIIVYVDNKENEPKFYTSGYKNRESKTPTDPNSLFKIASVGKLYTALAITKLAYQDRISLDKTLDYYFPELTGRIENMDKITVRMLVQHRSGIPDYTRFNDYWSHPKETDKERLELVLDKPAHFKPNKKFKYSNTNYLLLSKIIEKITGEVKFNFIQKEILEPLNLKNTYGSIKDVNLDDVMSGYYVGYEFDLKADDNGLMLATAEDLGAFIRALNNGSVFKNKEEQTLYESLYKYEHTGMIPGFQTIAKYHEDIDTVIIQFTNTTNFNGYNWSLSEIMYKRILRIIKKEN
ncbi:serine hydrolase [Winogradskyella sp.]|jgi:CubicO group peptidase (beta-lactamase class C family)|uniref:serine hydrolase domain-containing protein n=1 Tax=Winogradskyella sp. TaxID=1883156 RepID=UPI0025E22B10|nr:serine hydrolase domain-containing protein [Winogradskyella sp.]MCT4628732.1 beta-lactamase family protein [Winogradskyella sp.]